MKSARLLISGLLVIAGVLISHAAGYGLAASGGTVSGHAYTDVLGVIVVPGSLAVIAGLVARSGLRQHVVQLNWVAILAAQMILLVAQETLEAISSGGGLVSTKAVLLALAVQPIVAVLLRRFVATSRQIAQWWQSSSHARRVYNTDCLRWSPQPSLVPVRCASLGSQTRRGPPTRR
ncbi:MAG: hypothetical protein ACKVKO_07555 [Acidimicrobiales bacterium]